MVSYGSENARDFRVIEQYQLFKASFVMILTLSAQSRMHIPTTKLEKRQVGSLNRYNRYSYKDISVTHLRARRGDAHDGHGLHQHVEVHRVLLGAVGVAQGVGAAGGHAHTVLC